MGFAGKKTSSWKGVAPQRGTEAREERHEEAVEVRSEKPGNETPRPTYLATPNPTRRRAARGRKRSAFFGE